MKRLVSLLVLAVAALVAAGVTAAARTGDYTLKATLTAAQEVPKPAGTKAGEGGTFTATLTESGRLKWKLSFHGLTGAAGAAHIHLGRRGKAGPVAVALCGPCTSGKSGSTVVPKKFRDAVEHGAVYVNVHTTKNAGGEIRGQIRQTEEED
jgi:hypothetical protein